MPVKYIPENNGTQLTIDNFKTITKYSFSQLLALLGLDAIEEEKELALITGIYPQMTIFLRIPEINGEISRTFKFDEREIYNGAFEIGEDFQANRIGTNVFTNQVINCHIEGFETITIMAAGEPGLSEYNGFWVWGNMGYKMEGGDHNTFLD